MADDNELINQADIEALLQGGAGQSSPPPDSGSDAKPEEDSGGEIDQSEIEKLLGNKDASAAESAPAAQAAAPPPQSAAEEIADADKLLAQDDIEKLLNQSGAGGASAQPASTSQPAPAATAAPSGNDLDAESISQGDVEFLFSQAERALDSVAADTKELPPSATPFQFGELQGSPANTESATLDLINDVELDLKIELGRTNMYLEDVLKLRKGAVVPLDKLAGDPVDIYVNGRLIARGEVLVLNDNFCVRVAELVATTAPAL